MKITVISDANSWMNHYMPEFIKTLLHEGHAARCVHRANEIPEGDLVFYLGCGQLISPSILRKNKHNLVLHESALPKGKGWSPLTWQILEGVEDIPITLFEAVEEVDSGPIYLQKVMHFQGTELVDELREIQANTSIKMCFEFIHSYPEIVTRGTKQEGESSIYLRRKPIDSRLNPDKTIREQFNLLRIVDNERYPAFFELNGQTYLLKIQKKITDERGVK